MAARAVRVITEVAAVDRPFDYVLSDATEHVGVGDRVRVDFNHRSVRGWVIDGAAPAGDLKTVKKWLGYGPPSSMLDLLLWASERWYGTWSRFLLASSSRRVVTTLPRAPAKSALALAIKSTATVVPAGVLQLAPTTDPLALVLGAYEATRDAEGSLLVLVPTESWAGRLRGRLEQRGCAVASGEQQWDRARAGWPVVVGARGTALAPVPRVAGAVVIDADDESYRSSATPTWEAVAMLRERCARDKAPLWCTSMIPSPALLNGDGYEKDRDLAGGWPRVEVVDRRLSDPHEGVLAPVALAAADRALAGDDPVAVAVILQRLGTGRLLACVACGELARCASCQQAEEEVGEQLACAERHEFRARFCRSCGSTNLKRLRVGVTTLARDVAAQLRQRVSEVTAALDPSTPLERVVVGTEATWQRVRRCGVIIFVDFDQYLLAPRESSRRSAVNAVGKAGRLVGSRRERRGLVVLQTRRGDDDVVRALASANFDDVIADDVATARLLSLNPYGACADVTGEGAEAFVTELARSLVSVHQTPTGYVVRAKDAMTLTRALRSVQRPAQKFRVAVQ
ncbi:MAG: primosomal protein N' family DNA-binding protein [Acidimicrobiales bacterium]